MDKTKNTNGLSTEERGVCEAGSELNEFSSTLAKRGTAWIHVAELTQLHTKNDAAAQSANDSLWTD